jgi:hypothetical protein
MQTWAQALIDERYPPTDLFNAIAELRSVVEFFAGERSQLFGMTTSPDKFLDGAALVASAKAGVVAWFEHAGRTGDDELQARLYPLIDIEVPEPALVRQRREAAAQRDAAKQQALLAIPRPIEAVTAVAPALAAALRTLRDGVPADFFEAHGAMLHPKEDPSLNAQQFEWHDVDLGWDELLGPDFPPVFFPFAGANGDYLGVFVVGAPDDQGVVSFYSHEEGLFFMAQSLGHFRAMCDAAAKGSLREVARVRGRPAKMNAVENVENAYTRAFQDATAALARL